MGANLASARAFWFKGRLPLYLTGFAIAAVLDRATPFGVAEWLIEVALVCIATILGDSIEMLLVGALATGCSLLGLWTSPSSGEPFWLESINRLASLGVIWVAVYIGRQQRRAAAEIRVLRGMLPICASCKKIRYGEDEWESLEGYISSHSEATFTHSLCPECFARYYAEIERK